MIAILPLFRVSAHARPTVGSHTALHDGVYEIIWDNTYSRSDQSCNRPQALVYEFVVWIQGNLLNGQTSLNPWKFQKSRLSLHPLQYLSNPLISPWTVDTLFFSIMDTFCAPIVCKQYLTTLISGHSSAFSARFSPVVICSTSLCLAFPASMYTCSKGKLWKCSHHALNSLITQCHTYQKYTRSPWVRDTSL